jgi:hypothetical protein
MHQSLGLTLPQIPLDFVPLLPYFAFVFLVLSFSLWGGYLTLIAYDAGRVPRLQRQIVIGVSISGKLLLAGVHGLVWIGYMRYFAEWRQPDWLVVFSAAQAWWDCLLLGIYSCLVGWDLA